MASSELLKQIQAGKKLKKAETNDRSAPAVDPKPGGAGAGPRAPTSAPVVPSGGGPPQLGGLFAGGMPKLRPSGQGNLGLICSYHRSSHLVSQNPQLNPRRSVSHQRCQAALLRRLLQVRRPHLLGGPLRSHRHRLHPRPMHPPHQPERRRHCLPGRLPSQRELHHRQPASLPPLHRPRLHLLVGPRPRPGLCHHRLRHKLTLLAPHRLLLYAVHRLPTRRFAECHTLPRAPTTLSLFLQLAKPLRLLQPDPPLSLARHPERHLHLQHERCLSRMGHRLSLLM